MPHRPFKRTIIKRSASRKDRGNTWKLAGILIAMLIITVLINPTYRIQLLNLAYQPSKYILHSNEIEEESQPNQTPSRNQADTPAGQEQQGSACPEQHSRCSPTHNKWLNQWLADPNAVFTSVAALSSVFGLLVLVFQTRAIRESVDITRLTVVNADRPYVIFTNPSIKIEGPTGQIDCRMWVVTVTLENFGRTPALMHKVAFNGPYTRLEPKPDQDAYTFYRAHFLLAPRENGAVENAQKIYRFTNYLHGVSDKAVSELFRRKGYFADYVEYTDVFGIRRRTGNAFEFDGIGYGSSVSTAGGRAYNYDADIEGDDP